MSNVGFEAVAADQWMDPALTTSSCGGRAPEFPSGLRVLLVDDDATCLKVIERMLLKCRYDVTICSRAAEALSVLRERKGRFDLVLSDVRMPDMDGFKLLEHVGLEMDLPVIMMSADDHKDVVMKGVTHGAVDYLIKPVGMEPLRNIWQHVVRKKRFELKELEHSGSLEENDRQKRTLEEEENVTSGSGENWKTVKRKSEGKDDGDDEEGNEREDTSQAKKPRAVWSVELHQQFVTAVNQLGIDKAVPKKILELMKVPGFTRENVASHLQKYRLYLRRLSVANHQGRIDGPFTSTQEALIPSVGAVDGISFQALAVPGQFLPQSLTVLPPSARRVENTRLSLPVLDQVGFLNTVNIQNASRKKSESTQLISNGGLNYSSGIPDTIQSRHVRPQYDHLHGNIGFKVEEAASIFVNPPSSQTTRSSLAGSSSNGPLSKSSIMHVLPQGHQFSLSRNQENFPIQAFSDGQISNNMKGYDSMLSSTIWQQMSPNVTPRNISGRYANAFATPLNMNNARASSLSIPQSLYSNKQNAYMSASSASSYPLANCIEAANITGSAETSSNTSSLKGASDFLPSYDMISELYQKTQDWKPQNVNLSYHSLLHQDSPANIKDRNINITSVRKEEIAVRTETGHKNADSITLYNSKILAGNSVAVKSESLLDAKYEDVFCVDSIISNELMSIVGKPQQQGVGEEESRLVEGYSLDNIQV